MSLRFTVEVSLALGADITADPATWVWTDITSKCLVREGGVSIRRGRPDWQTSATPATCEVLVNNSDGRFSRLNPSGTYFGQLTKNTPLRVRACAVGGSLTTRFVGFVSEWPPRWEPSEQHFWVPIRADGVLRRLGQGNSPAKSYLREALQQTEPLAYWPCEDSIGSTAAGSAISGVASMTATSTVLFGEATPPIGALTAPDMSTGGILIGLIPSTAIPTYWVVQFTAKIATSGSTFTLGGWTGTGSVSAWSVQVTSTQVNLQYTVAGVTSTAVSLTTSLFDGNWHGFYISLQTSSTSIFCTVTVDANSNTGTVASQTSGLLTSVTAGGVTTGELLSVGHITVGASDSFIAGAVIALNTAGAGDFARARFTAVCSAESIQSDTSGTAATSVLLGSQTTNTVLGLLREIEAADSGLIVERLTGKLGYDPHDARENLSVTLALDYSLGHIKPPFEPTDDDRLTRNDVTVARIGGSSARVVDSASVATMGTYDDSVTLNLYADDQPIHNAGWRVNLGTVNEYRYPTVHLMFHSSASLLTTWLTCDIGSRVTISNLPTSITYDLVDQIIEGYAERINNFEWDVVLNLSPYKPYKIFQMASTSGDTNQWSGRLAGSDSAAIRAAINTSTTSIAFDPNIDFWTTVADDFTPALKVRVDGEVVSASAISNTYATFVAAGTAAHASNASVTPTLPAGVQTGDLLLIWCAIRNSGAGVPNAPTGYTRLPVFATTDNCQLFGKVHSGSESDPTVTFTGGVANATTSAQMAAFRNTPTTLPDLADIVVYAVNQLNSSAQNIAYPDLPATKAAQGLLLWLGWKQDDWTSVATLGGVTEIGDTSSVLGDDQGIVWDYISVGASIDVAAGSFTVTGGASAISRGAVVALVGGYQTMTVTRSTNGVTKSHAAGALVEVEDAFVIGL